MSGIISDYMLLLLQIAGLDRLGAFIVFIEYFLIKLDNYYHHRGELSNRFTLMFAQ